ncbi:helix-turn-helix domain-containing protein [Sorangium sp. So ce1099]|uniref:helix-turn-helix domain-containing protein n=1 Tax=Sorangium sp. So ce1099 TaxID=3133331 RepID=UPI003F6335DD
MNYGKGIRIVRAARGISQKDLAAMAGLNGNYISLIESGSRVPSVEALDSLAKALSVPVYLIALLGSNPEDLKGMSVENAERLGKALLETLIDHEQANGGSDGRRG